MTAIDDLKPKIKTHLEELEKRVARLFQDMTDAEVAYTREYHRLGAAKEFYRIEFEPNGSRPATEGEPRMVDVPLRFANMTIRKAAEQVLRESGAQHVSEVQKILEAGGRKTTKSSVASILLRGEEFERVPDQQNTFKIREG